MAADIVGAFVKPIMEKLGELIFEKVKRQFIYLCCFNSNIQSLRKEVENLKNEGEGLNRRVETAIRNTEGILPAVEEWLKLSNEIQENMNGIEQKIRNVKSGCLAIKSRFVLSRKARKTADDIEAHRKLLGNFTVISTRADPAATAQVPQGPSDEFDSRKQIEEEIMEDLRGGNVHMMGICGMGGVGKTTMAERIWTRMRVEKLFDEVLMVVISQEIREFEIQREIAEKLCLDLKEQSLSGRKEKTLNFG